MKFGRLTDRFERLLRAAGSSSIMNLLGMILDNFVFCPTEEIGTAASTEQVVANRTQPTEALILIEVGAFSRIIVCFYKGCVALLRACTRT